MSDKLNLQLSRCFGYLCTRNVIGTINSSSSLLHVLGMLSNRLPAMPRCSLVQFVDCCRMLVYQRLRFSTVTKSVFGLHLSRVRSVNLLVEKDCKTIVVVSSIRIVRKSVLPIHIGHSLFQRRFLPQRKHLSPRRILHSIKVRKTCLWCEPTCARQLYSPCIQ